MANPTTIVHRIANAVRKIGTANGTKIVEPEYNGDQSNEARAKWFDEWTILAEALVADATYKAAEGRRKKAVEKLKATFQGDIKKMSPGDKRSIVRGNVSVLLDMRNGQTSLDEAAMRVELQTEYKWAFEDVEAFINRVKKRGSAKLYTTYSSTQE